VIKYGKYDSYIGITKLCTQPFKTTDFPEKYKTSIYIFKVKLIHKKVDNNNPSLIFLS
jgi:hypothetical protein